MGGATAALDYDAELMLRVRGGDRMSFAALLDKHRSSVVHFLCRMVGNQAVAEELAQEVFLRVYRSRGSYAPTARFTTWLFRIATHTALNALRDGKRPVADGSPDQAAPRAKTGHPAGLGNATEPPAPSAQRPHEQSGFQEPILAGGAKNRREPCQRLAAAACSIKADS